MSIFTNVILKKKCQGILFQRGDRKLSSNSKFKHRRFLYLYVVIHKIGEWGALCVIFPILVSFSRDNALFASKAKINVFLKKIRVERIRRFGKKWRNALFNLPSTHFSSDFGYRYPLHHYKQQQSFNIKRAFFSTRCGKTQAKSHVFTYISVQKITFNNKIVNFGTFPMTKIPKNNFSFQNFSIENT